VTAEQALEIGYELAMRWTRKHQFVVAAHANTNNNPHTHIFFNSKYLDYGGSFRILSVRQSSLARQQSDKLRLEHGLRLAIENRGC